MAIIGIDLGATKISGALFSDEGMITERTGITLNGKSGNDVGLLIKQLISRLLDRRAAVNVSAAGICVPGIAHTDSGNVWAPNIPGWDDYPLRSELKSFFGDHLSCIRVESDRTCYILGELWQGAAMGCRHAIYLSVGTGIGAGILVDGKVLHGSGDIAGAIGWLALQSPYRDEYINCGCFEYYASGTGIALNMRKMLDESNDKGYFRDKSTDNIGTEDVFTAYSMKDENAAKVIGKAVKMWGMAAANLVSIFDPEKIIFGGGVFGPASVLLGDIKKEAEKWAQPVSIKKVKFENSFLKGDAGLYGAGYIALNPGFRERGI